MGRRSPLLRAVGFGVLVGGIFALVQATWADPPLPGPKTEAEKICKGDQTCEGFQLTNDTSCPKDPDGKYYNCLGQKIKGDTTKFTGCRKGEKTDKCTSDASKYAQVSCPGLCSDPDNKTCSVTVPGCPVTTPGGD
jgi:hypothetical protein